METWIVERGKRQYARKAEIRDEVAATLTQKLCWRCRAVLPIDEFDWRADRSKGRKTACRGCEDPNGTKRCRSCQQIKPKSEFHKNIQGGYLHWQSDCKACQKGFMRKYRLAEHYGMTVEDYDRLLVKQSGKCAICDTPPADDGVLRVDHDHRCCPGDKTCGKCVRGLLCDRCNRGLGYFRDDKQSLRTAIAYIERYELRRAA